MLCAWSSSVKLFQRTSPLLSASVFVVSLVCFEVDLWLASFHGESDCSVMFKRSFTSKGGRARKSVRSSRKKYDERTKAKLQESLDESLGKYVSAPLRCNFLES